MNEILLCTHNPILRKSLYGILRDEGYSVAAADHPSLAVHMALEGSYRALIIDPEPFGISAEDAVRIIKAVLPDMLVIFIGCDKLENDALALRAPVDLEEFRRTIHDVRTLGASHS